jgi:hypothetical protein
MDVDASRGDQSDDAEIVAAAFRRAAAEAVKLGHGVDGFLHFGSLDCGTAREFLRTVLGDLPEYGEIWSYEHLARNATWPDADQIPADDLWAYWSARKFHEVCLECRLTLSVS